MKNKAFSKVWTKGYQWGAAKVGLPDRSDSVPVSSPLYMMIFVLKNFNFKLMYF